MTLARRICVVANPASGKNSKGDTALAAAMEAFGDRAELRRWSPETDLSHTVRTALDDGFDIIVAAGGDGTIVSVAQAMLGEKAAMGVLPLGTFNYFARGLGLPEDPAEAARAVLEGETQPLSVGEVNGQVFLNNASIGLYPYILQQREDAYRRFGRSRMLAYWSALRTFVHIRRPRPRTITANGESRTLRSPLIFAARSAYQLREFGLTGAQAVERDKIALWVVHETTRGGMFVMAWRLMRKRLRAGEDVDLIIADDVEVAARHTTELIAFDGEKKHMSVPVKFRMRPDAINVVMPKAET